MTNNNYLPRLLLAAVCALSISAFADEEPSVKLDRPGAGMQEIKKGSKLPDGYKREALALKDWDKRHLTAPGENEQWVEIQDKYVLVNIPSGLAKTLVDKSAVQK
jgi:Ni/Co efflux regulator RcnB